MDAAQPALRIILVLRLGEHDAAERRADPRADIVVVAAQLHAGIVERHARRRDRELAEALRALGLLAVEECSRVEIVHLTRDLRTHLRRVESIDRFDAAPSADGALPKGFPTDADRRDRADAGDEDPAHAGRSISCLNRASVAFAIAWMKKSPMTLRARKSPTRGTRRRSSS